MKSRLVPRDALSDADRAAMFTLLDRHFEGVTPTQFAADLGDKNWALLLEDDAGLVGFSTIRYDCAEFAGARRWLVYSGDTIIDPRGWHSFALPRHWIESVWSLHQPHRDEPLWWLLITSGYRTYRFLPVFWREFFPRHDAAMPDDVRQFRDAQARDRFGAAFDARAGVVRFHHPQVLREHLSGVEPGRMNDPHVAFFLRTNPGHERGDELVCIAELSPSNLTPAGRRMVRPAAPGGRRGAGTAAP